MQNRSLLEHKGLKELAAKAVDAAAMLKALSNEHRLLVLCNLAAARELTAGELVDRIGLSQSAVSQHLARLRAEGLIAYRREAQTLFYYIVDPRAEQVLALLRDIFCPETEAANPSLTEAVD